LHIAIIGGGFCGTLLALNLIHKAQKPLQITLIEKSADLAKGVDYSTKDPYHLLNVRTKKMGAFHEEPDHFFQWLNANEALWRNENRHFEQLIVDPEGYLPRRLYGVYLDHLLKEGRELAKAKNISLTLLTKEAVDLQSTPDEVLITFLDLSTLQADFAVLALGVPPNKNFMPSETQCPQYIQSLWSANILASPQVENLDPNTEVVIIGTGLTMLDAMASLVLHGFKGKMTAISRTGVLSKVHAKQIALYPPFVDVHNPPKTALEMFKLVRQEIKKAEKEGKDWRSVIDAFREIIGPIWERLSWEERKKAVRHLLNNWNYFRHRMPWVYFNELQTYMHSDKFTLFRGAVVSLEWMKENKISVLVKSHEGSLKVIEAHYIINCSGPERNINAHPSVLVQNLLKRGEIVPDPLQLGIRADAHGRLLGKGNGRLYALGHLLLGERLETTAVPDLRKQCADLAHFILKQKQDSRIEQK
jgi:uncharacterized NAD(P)/FAD-binding protein YdhS